MQSGVLPLCAHAAPFSVPAAPHVRVCGLSCDSEPTVHPGMRALIVAPFLGTPDASGVSLLGPETVSSVRLDGGGRYKPPSTTASVASLLSDSALPASSVKVTRNLMVLPTSPEATT